MIVYDLISVTNAGRCSRIPEGSGARRTVSPGNFRIRLSDDSGVYKPGRTYTGIEENLFFLYKKNYLKIDFY